MPWIASPSHLVSRLARRWSGQEGSYPRALPCSATEFDLLASEMIAQGHAFRLQVWGDSMYPSIRSGDIVLVEPVEVQSLRQGDVLFYRRPWGHLAHRLVELRDGGNVLVTKGDALDYHDPPFGLRDLLGRVVAVERGARGAPELASKDRLPWVLARFLRRCSAWIRLAAKEQRYTL